MGSDLIGDGDFKNVLASLGRTPELINDMLLRVPQSSWNARPFAGEWSFAENVCHLRDLEREGYGVRIVRILEEERPFLPDFDGGKIARERSYVDQDAGQAFKDFAAARANNVARLAELDHGSLERTATLEGSGVITLRRLMDFIQEHDSKHLDDLGRLFESFNNQSKSQGF